MRALGELVRLTATCRTATAWPPVRIGRAQQRTRHRRQHRQPRTGDFTALGDTVNAAFRISSARARRHIALGQQTYDTLRKSTSPTVFRPRAYQLKGLSSPARSGPPPSPARTLPV
jgi:class 3 adenylate cyclase